MGTSIAQIKYGNYAFVPVPQVGIRDSTKRIGALGMGPGNRERLVTLKGLVLGNNLHEVQNALWSLQAAMAIENQIFTYHDGIKLQASGYAQPLSVESPEEWGQFEQGYNVQLKYIPLGETHETPATVSYNGYTFNPIPVMGRDLTVNRDSADSITRESATVTITLQGFIDKGSISANFTELNLLIAALATDGTLAFGPFTQSVRVGKCTLPADIGDSILSYTLTFTYNAQIPADGVIKKSSTRRIDTSYRRAIHYIPFQDDAILQKLGRNGQTITATGYIIADTIVNARIAANVEVNSLFPNDIFGVYQMARQITEKPSDNRVDWNVTYFYPVPVLTGGIYGGLPDF